MARYQTHLVAFVDLLGFREALRDSNREDAILSLLRRLSAFQGDFFAESHKMENGHQSRVRPAVSAFSDNIVLSFRLDELDQHALSVDVVILFLQNLVAYIAWNAFQSRLLIRGGLAMGDLYHEGGVVFGPALVEAYEIERSVAIYPRVALGPSVTQSGGFDKLKAHTWYHDDGVAVLGYMMGFVMRTEAAGSRFNPMVKTWLAHVRQTIDAEIAYLSSTKNVKAKMKWSWFKNSLETNVARMNPALLESDTPLEHH
jgi:hypothetical protein